jgi:hypothetical protein
MSRTVARTRKRKKHSVEELRSLLIGVTWRSFVSTHETNRRQRPSCELGGVVFHARYGCFLNMTGVGLVAEKQLLRFVPCWCPVRSDLSNSQIMGKYDPPWDSLHKLDLEYPHHNEDKGLILKAFKGSENHPLKADDPVLGTNNAS